MNHRILLMVVFLCGGLTSAIRADVIGYWDFDEKLPGQVASMDTGAIKDSSGNTHDGTVVGGNLDYVVGAPGYGNGSALSFNQATSESWEAVEVPGHVFYHTGSFTFETLINTIMTSPGSGASDKFAGTLWSSGSSKFWIDDDHPGKLRIDLNDGTHRTRAWSSGMVNDGKWHHVAFVYDAEDHEARIYIDYALDGSIGTSVLDGIIAGHDGATTTFGGYDDTRPEYQFIGDMDFARISSGVLGPDDFIRAIPEPSSLIVWLTGMICLAALRRRIRKTR